MDTVLEILIQMNIIVVVIVLIAEVVARFNAVRRRTVGVGEVEIHGTLVVSKAVRKVQPVGVALIEGVEVCETE